MLDASKVPLFIETCLNFDKIEYGTEDEEGAGILRI